MNSRCYADFAVTVYTLHVSFDFDLSTYDSLDGFIRPYEISTKVHVYAVGIESLLDTCLH